MNIWYLHHYATPHNISGMHRPYEFGKYFDEYGCKTTVFSSSYLHYADANMINDHSTFRIDEYEGIKTVFIKTCDYKKSGAKRIINMLQFGIKLPFVASKVAKENGKPDVIIASSPHPFTMLAGLKIAKKFRIPCICEVRDFWPEVFFFSGKISEKSLLGRLLLRVERYIYEKADGINFLKEGDYTYIIEKGWDKDNGGKIDLNKCIYVNNGVDVKNYDERIAEYDYCDEDLNSGKFNIVYCGAIRPVNNIDLILDVAKIVGEDYNFLVFGSGNCIENLQKRIDTEKIKNVILKGYVDNKYIPSILSKSSLNLLNYSGTSYNWSRGNSSNKLFEYLASGKPVLSTVKMGYDILEKYNCGISVEKTTAEKIAEKICQIKSMQVEEYNRLCRNARKAAEDFDIPLLAKKYFVEIERIINNYSKNR